MEIRPLDQLTKIINDALNGTAKLHKSFKTFFVTTSILFLSMTKRKKFTQMTLFSDFPVVTLVIYLKPLSPV